MSFLLKIFPFLRNEAEDAPNVKAIKRDTGYGKYSVKDSKDSLSLGIIAWNCDEGKQRLLESKYNFAFFSLAHTYQSQISPFHAGIACMTNVLNALRLDRGVVPDSKERSFKLFDRDTGEIRENHFNIYSQKTLLDSETDQIKKRQDIIPEIKDEVAYVDFDVFNPGLSIVQVKQILELYKCKVELSYANDDTARGIATLTEQLKECLITKERIIIANFNGGKLGMLPGGHYGTIGGYHAKSNSVLVLDVAAHETPWFWVPVEELYNAMNSDAREGRRRGYIIIEDTV